MADGFGRIFLDQIFVVMSAKGNGMWNKPIDIGSGQPKGEYIVCHIVYDNSHMLDISNFFARRKFFNKRLVKEFLNDKEW